ncbi:MAG: PQQ-like beta-propeller repeat protein [Akkermansiaceae bacterium]|jgi:outer membrane protein assembly factor BamB|nr:PQQ-like beta-propeller repeat protein [Akkermansiaceae bacterium]
MNPLIIGSHGAVAAIDPETGSVLWKTLLETGSFMSSTKAQDVSVLVQGGMVFAGGFGHLFCLEANSGRILWHNPLKGFGHNDISLAMDGVSVQFLAKVERSSNGPGR